MRHDAVIVGGGHNGLTAAAYLARAGRSVLLLERRDELGGAAVSARPFAGVDVRLSRYSYLVSLLPRRIVGELGLPVRLLRRRISSYTPGLGLIRTGQPPPREPQAWARWQAMVDRLAAAVAPTLTERLPTRAAVERAVGDAAAWEALVGRPLGEAIEATFADDLLRGVVLTDGLIGTATDAHDPSLRQNRCFLYHVAGGPWDVPAGGMGALTAALAGAARAAGAELRTGATVTAIDPGEVAFTDAGGAEHRVAATHVLAGCAPAVLDRLRGREPAGPAPRGSQVKVNLVLDRLPALRDGTDPRDAFAGTFHAAEGYAHLQSGATDPLPCEAYCHTLTDPSIAPAGHHALTVFGLRATTDGSQPLLRGIEEALSEPLDDVITRDADGRPCVEVATPEDLERDLAMPGGHIFHRDLQWPWAEAPGEAGTWGVETEEPWLLLCGAGARRGGGVSGIPGRAAAMAVLGR